MRYNEADWHPFDAVLKEFRQAGKLNMADCVKLIREIPMGAEVEHEALTGFTSKNTTNYPTKARDVVLAYVESHLDVTDGTQITLDDVFVVWFSKTLQNWKALVSTTLPDGMYYEVTYNGDKGETYVDVYKKFDNVKVRDEVIPGVMD